MSSISPIATDAKPVLDRIDSDIGKTPLSPASSITPSSPASPRPQYARTAATSSDTTIFAKIRSSKRSRSRSINRCNSSPASSPTILSEEQQRHPHLHLRSDSSLSTPTSSMRKRSRSNRRSSGTVMDVGRHGNDWLFGGFSFTEAVKGLLSPTNSEHGNK